MLKSPRTQPLASTNGTAGATAGRKRKTEVGPTPSQSKGQVNTWSTFNQAEEDDLLGVVLVQDNPYKKLTMNQANRIRKELIKHLKAIIDQRDTVIHRFDEVGLKHGRCRLSCYAAHSFAWVEGVVNLLELTGANTQSRLRLVKPSHIPQLQRAEVYISGPPLGVSGFIKLLTAQNSGLHTERSVVRHQQTTAHGQLLVCVIDRESAAAIEAANSQLYCGISCVFVRAPVHLLEGVGH